MNQLCYVSFSYITTGIILFIIDRRGILMRNIIYVILFTFFISISFTTQAWAIKGKCVSGDCMNGTGTMNYDNGKTYEGTWKDGMPNGQGTFSWPDDKENNVIGGNIIGQYQKGELNGQATATYSNGTTFTGLFKNDKFVFGKGLIYHALGDVMGAYRGQIANEDRQPNGRGIWKGDDGSFFEGEFKNGIPVSGKYKLFFDNGNTICEGQYKVNKDGKAEGIGTDTTIITDNQELTKRVYTGQLLDLKYHGSGSLCLYDQFGLLCLKFVGTFKEGKRFGKGTTYTYNRNGVIIKTESGWYDGDFLGNE